MSDGSVDTERSVVKTYVPAYQKDRWRRQAEELEMSQSEFVRTMVQAGRRGFEGYDDRDGGERERSDGANGESSNGATETQKKDESPGTPAPSDRIDEHVVQELSPGEHRSWETLRDALATELVDDRLEDALQRLQRENRVQYSGRHGGYTLVSDR